MDHCTTLEKLTWEEVAQIELAAVRSDCVDLVDRVAAPDHAIARPTA
jgi:hypothetical protein